MINYVKQTPIEYSKQSRDYQSIARLLTILANHTKMMVDDTDIWDTNCDNKLLDLRARTLNFEPDHAWDEEELEAIESCFKKLIMNKGNQQTLKNCVNILMKTLGIASSLKDDAIRIDSDRCIITIWADTRSVSLGMIEDLVKYLLPIGYGYRLIQYKSMSSSDAAQTEIFYNKDTIDYSTFDYTPDADGRVRPGVIGHQAKNEDKYKTSFKSTIYGTSLNDATNEEPKMGETWIYSNNYNRSDNKGSTEIYKAGKWDDTVPLRPDRKEGD